MLYEGWQQIRMQKVSGSIPRSRWLRRLVDYRGQCGKSGQLPIEIHRIHEISWNSQVSIGSIMLYIIIYIYTYNYHDEELWLLRPSTAAVYVFAKEPATSFLHALLRTGPRHPHLQMSPRNASRDPGHGSSGTLPARIAILQDKVWRISMNKCYIYYIWGALVHLLQFSALSIPSAYCHTAKICQDLPSCPSLITLCSCLACTRAGPIPR